MRVHHFYPKTDNVGDHFVQKGIAQMVREIVPDVTFDLFNVNSRGHDGAEYGLTQSTIERANREADVVVVGGSNLYEGSLRWHWGVHLESGALKNLRVPLLLLGLGAGSNFLARLHRPSRRAVREIRLLNQTAAFSGARDVITLEWLRSLGVFNAELMGDPATFIFNRPVQICRGGHVMITLPPRRFWTSKTRFWPVLTRGRAMFRALVSLAQTLRESGQRVVVVCNDPADLTLIRKSFEKYFAERVVCPRGPDEYFGLLLQSRAVLTGRLHTAVAAFSLGIPFVLIDADQRTRGFIKTYQLEDWTVAASQPDFSASLAAGAHRLLNDDILKPWETLIARRDEMHLRAAALLRLAFRALN